MESRKTRMKKEKRMEAYEKERQCQNINLEKLNEELLDVLSLVILLENDMEAQKVDGIYVRLIKMVHYAIKNIQKNLLQNRQPKTTENK